jgi:hypothetical protein
MFFYRRVKNDEGDAGDLADLLRMGSLPEAWIAPAATREPRGWVRHRAKLVGLRSNLKCQVHGVLAGAGVMVVMSDLFGVGGQRLLAGARLAPESRARVESAMRLIEALDFEVELFAKLVAGRLRTDGGYQAIQVIPGVGPLRGRPFGPISDPDAYPGALTDRRRTARRKIRNRNGGLTGPAPSGMTGELKRDPAPSRGGVLVVPGVACWKLIDRGQRDSSAGKRCVRRLKAAL